jgi:hypothetical protein
VKRRDFLKQSLSASAVVVGAGYASWDMIRHKTTFVEKPIQDRAIQAAAKVLTSKNPSNDEGVLVKLETSHVSAPKPETLTHSRPALAYEQHKAEQWMAKIPVDQATVQPIEEIVLTEAQKSQAENAVIAKPNESAKSVQEKVANFEANFTDDVVLNEEQYKLLVQSLERINRVQEYVGFGNFNVISFDEALKYGKYSPRIGEFTASEKAFLDQLFHYDTSQLGFFGEKVISKQTNVITDKDVIKMPGTGHYVFRGHPEEFYKKIRQEVGDSLILTSGVRNIVKQYQLYLAKTVQASGNLSRASRSLAPPGHSYHAIGDFDVGQVGGGFNNFTASFAKTDEFKRLQDLGYVKIRYTANNDLGVRYEPWHIRVV